MLHYKLQYEWNGRTMHRIYTKGTPNVFSRSRRFRRASEGSPRSGARRWHYFLSLYGKYTLPGVALSSNNPSPLIFSPVASTLALAMANATRRPLRASLFRLQPHHRPGGETAVHAVQKSSVPLMLLDKHDVPAYMAPTAANTPPELTMYEPVFLTARRLASLRSSRASAQVAFNAPMTEPIPNIAAEALHTR